MNDYLGKSLNQSEGNHCETIVEHTNNLLRQYNLLKQTYPDIFQNFWLCQNKFNNMLEQPNIHGKDDWRLLEIACAYHDLRHTYRRNTNAHKIKINKLKTKLK